MNILVVDDEALIRSVIKTYCINEGYNCLEAENGYDAINKVQNEKIDLIILDIMMPKMDGFKTLEEMKKFTNIPVIMLSARTEEEDKLSSFSLGVDDYVTKPFSPKELMARIKAILKRNTKTYSKFIYKTLELDYKGRTLKIDGITKNITPKEFDLLVYFIENAGVALSREQLLNNVWGYDFYGDDRTVDTHIKMLRHNLGIYRNLIETVRSIGYKFEYEDK